MIKLGVETENYTKNNEMLISFLRNRDLYVKREKKIFVDINIYGDKREVVIEAKKEKDCKCIYRAELKLIMEPRKFVKELIIIEGKLKKLGSK